jgi:hypothetical protein
MSDKSKPGAAELERAWEVRVSEQAADLAIFDAILETLLINLLSRRPRGEALLAETQGQVVAC